MTDVWYNDRSLIEQGGIVQDVSALPRPARNMTEIIVPGRDGSLHVFDGSVRAASRTVTVQVRTEEDRARVNAWCAPSGWLRVETEPDWAYRATQSDPFEWDHPSPALFRARIPFSLFPYRYRLPLSHKLAMTSPRAILNPFDAESEPSLTITGSGDIALRIGNQDISIAGLQGTITMDSEIQAAYAGAQPMNNSVSGSFPKLLPGTNEITWTGDVSALVIAPRWRAGL